jgi:hypothetical protein
VQQKARGDKAPAMTEKKWRKFLFAQQINSLQISW